MGHQHTYALPRLEPQQGLGPRHISPGFPLPLSGGQDGEIKALEPGSLSANPASAIHWLEPQFLHL